jgi:hypothetical protein
MLVHVSCLIISKNIAGVMVFPQCDELLLGRWLMLRHRMSGEMMAMNSRNNFTLASPLLTAVQ